MATNFITLAAKVAPKIELPQPLLVKITYTRSATHSGTGKAATLKALGLRHLHQSIVHKNIRPIRGMIHDVKEFVSVQPINVVPEKNTSL